MNFNLPHIPERNEKVRTSGITMVMDKGLSICETENFIQSSGQYADFVKFGFGTALVTPGLEQKIKLLKEANIRPYLGGTLFEIFTVRGLFDEFRKMIDKYKLEVAEISDGAIEMEHDVKCKYIETLAKQVLVISEVGSKDAKVNIPPEKWNAMMKRELACGAWKVIAEAREAGNLGIYNSDGSANNNLIENILFDIKPDNVIWEAPIKSQQVYFIKLLGSNVNLGNIAPNEVISLETLRLGLRGDTFYHFLPK